MPSPPARRPSPSVIYADSAVRRSMAPLFGWDCRAHGREIHTAVIDRLTGADRVDRNGRVGRVFRTAGHRRGHTPTDRPTDRSRARRRRPPEFKAFTHSGSDSTAVVIDGRRRRAAEAGGSHGFDTEIESARASVLSTSGCPTCCLLPLDPRRSKNGFEHSDRPTDRPTDGAGLPPSSRRAGLDCSTTTFIFRRTPVSPFPPSRCVGLTSGAVGRSSTARKIHRRRRRRIGGARTKSKGRGRSTRVYFRVARISRRPIAAAAAVVAAGGRRRSRRREH